MTRTRKPNLTVGIMLLVVGGVLLATRFVAIQAAPTWLLGIGVGLCLIAILGRSYASLVGGMVLLGLGAGMILGDRGAANLHAGTWILLGLGAGFIGIYLLALVLQLPSHWWPLVPGLVLVAVGGARLLRHFTLFPPEVVMAVRAWWPAALVLAGLWVVIRALRT
jgi:hypothetical protein